MPPPVKRSSRLRRMTRPRPLRARLLHLLGLLLIAAGLNVVVAWACSLWSPTRMSGTVARPSIERAACRRTPASSPASRASRLRASRPSPTRPSRATSWRRSRSGLVTARPESRLARPGSGGDPRNGRRPPPRLERDGYAGRTRQRRRAGPCQPLRGVRSAPTHNLPCRPGPLSTPARSRCRTQRRVIPAPATHARPE